MALVFFLDFVFFGVFWVRGKKFGFVAIYSPVNVRISRAGNVPNQEFIAYLDAAF